MMFVDALECSRFDGEIFQELRDGEMACVTVTCGFWEDAAESLQAIGHWRDLERVHGDLIGIAHSLPEIHALHAAGKTAIVLGFQNTALLESRIAYVELFASLGVRVLQLTYNNQNDVGGSCYEEHDSGLARFGREVVRECNRCGILVDLSHVGERTGLDAIARSDAPVAVTHANPASLYAHRRNKSDAFLKELAAHGGVLGCATYRNIAGPHVETLRSWCEMVAGAVELMGIEHVGIGTDLGRKVDEGDLRWMRMGRWTRTPNYGAGSASNPGKVSEPDWLTSTLQFPAIADGLAGVGFNAREVEAIMGGNWLRLYGQVFHA